MALSQLNEVKKMPKYEVTYTVVRTLAHSNNIVTVDADSAEDAEDKVMDCLDDAVYEIDYTDYDEEDWTVESIDNVNKV